MLLFWAGIAYLLKNVEHGIQHDVDIAYSFKLRKLYGCGMRMIVCVKATFRVCNNTQVAECWFL